MREALKVYTVEGGMGHLLDARGGRLASLADFTVFEIEELMNLGDHYALPVLLYLFRRIEMSLKGQPAMIVLDEAWIMLGHPVFRDKIREWLKVLRKANCMVLMATQSLSDAAQFRHPGCDRGVDRHQDLPAERVCARPGHRGTVPAHGAQ